ncbi:hypothetical protein [Hyphomonas sp.]|uniref:hypothetical protein n=1 Tax=Hyphomonas sp. TaxID=87 RepID=UPI003918944E
MRPLFARSWFVSLLGVLALLSMAARGAVPTNYMLVASGTPGQFLEIVVCHGDGSASTTKQLNLATGEYEPAGDSGSPDPDPSSDCPFAVSSAFSVPQPDAGTDRLHPGPVADVLRPAFVSPGRGLPAPPPPARAPPSLI